MLAGGAQPSDSVVLETVTLIVAEVVSRAALSRARAESGASNRVLLMVTSLSSIQQPLTDDGVGTLMLRQLRRYEFSTRRFGPGPNPDERAPGCGSPFPGCRRCG